MTETSAPHSRYRARALGPVGFVLLYLAVVLAPLALAWGAAPQGAGLAVELAGALAFTGYAMLLAQFALSGRFGVIGGRIGIDVVMRVHQAAARALTAVLLVHPFLYAAPHLISDPAAYGASVARMFANPAFASGIVAWIALIVLMVFAVFRARIAIGYEAWRASHGALALAIALGGLDHALAVGGLSAAPAVRALWVVLAIVAAATLTHAYVLRPLLQLRHPWRVADVRMLGPARWLLALEPLGPKLSFRAGQFVWLKIARHPFGLRENPFSIVSAPGGGRVEFLIREAGDFTGAIGRLKAGDRAWLDGPHGAFTLDAAGDARRIVMLAGGVGLAPCLSMLRDAAAKGDTRVFHLIFGNRTEGQIVPRDALAALAPGLDLRVDYVLSEPPAGWPGARGQMDAATLMPLLAPGGGLPDEAAYFLCGPPPMVAAAERTLAALGVPAGRVVTERFDYD